MHDTVKCDSVGVLVQPQEPDRNKLGLNAHLARSH